MCAPAALGVASLALTAIGTFQQMQAQNAQASYAQEVAQRNQVINERAALDAEKRGEREARLEEMKTAREVSRARAGLAAGGFDVNFGSSLMKQADIEAMGDLEEGRIRSDAEREAYGIRVQGVREQAGAGATIAKAKAGAQSSLIGGATQIASGLYGMSQKGVFG